MEEEKKNWLEELRKRIPKVEPEDIVEELGEEYGGAEKDETKDGLDVS
jgi:hypothetical protein